MERSRDREIGRLYRLLGELLPFTIVRKGPFDGWTCYDEVVRTPYSWNYTGEPICFKNEFTFARLESNEKLYLRGWFGGESLVLIDEKPYGEINQFHREVNLTPFCDGQKHTVEVQTVARGLFGSMEESIFKYAKYIVYDDDMWKILNFAKNVVEVANETNDQNLAKALINATDEFLSGLYVPRSSNVYIKTITENPSVLGQVMSTWSHPDFPDDDCVYDERVKASLMKSFDVYRDKIRKLNALFPKIGKAFIAGHAHIDYAWLWPIGETKRKIVRTFSNAVQLAKKYPEFIYIQSSAQMYEDIKKSHPQVFEDIRALIKSRRWETVGGMWVESDCNVPGVESLIRQFYYGQKFFIEEFAVKSKVAWLPDVFGFSWILPQVMKQSGIDYFVTTKLNWNEANDFPYDICRWRGIDGSEVIYYNFKNFEDGYNGRVSAKSLINTFNNFRQKDVTNEFFLSFGYGDGGGGPTEEMCENYAPLNEIPGVPYVEYSTAERFLETLGQEIDSSKLSVWDGELYLELHRGTLTSQSRTKRLHRRAENELRNTEIINALFDANYQERIDDLWKVLLHNEFHDILPGSAIKEVYEDAENELKYVIEECVKIQKSVVESRVEEYSDCITLFNPSSFDQKIHFIYDKPLRIFDGDKRIDCAKTFDGMYVYDTDEMILGLGYKTLRIASIEDSKFDEELDLVVQDQENEYSMENEKLKVIVNRDGSVNIFNKSIGKWAFEDAGNLLTVYGDVPAYWENWDIDVRSKGSERRLNASKITVVEKSPLRHVVRVMYLFDSSTIEQFYILEKGSDELKVQTKLDWHHRRTMLKTLFPTNVLSRYAKYDIDGGYIERPTHSNTNFEQARFEVLAHSWVDLSQYDYGVCILNDGKYGHKVNCSMIEMTLLKAGIYPDFYADEGYHEFSYSIYVHPSCDVKEFYRRADRLNREMITFNGKIPTPTLNMQVTNDNFRILSLRKSDGKLYLRILESVGSSGTSTVKISTQNMQNTKTIKEASLVDVLENRIKQLEVKDNCVTFDFKPFKFYTFEFSF